MSSTGSAICRKGRFRAWRVRTRPLSRFQVWLAGLLLAAAVTAVYFPIVGYEFVDYDVPEQLLENRSVRELTPASLQEIFTSWSVRSYYPVRTLTYAIDYKIWGGLEPTGFKLTGGVLHLTNVYLVFWLILRLFREAEPADVGKRPRREVWIAALGAGLFAVHPVAVEPVTWVAGREELLMTLGALGCIHFHLTFRRLEAAGGRAAPRLAAQGAAGLCCLAACLSNAVAAVIPLLIVAWDAITIQRPKLRRIITGTWGLWLLGAATIVVKRLGEVEHYVDYPRVLSGEWLATVLNVYWLNLKTLAWPADLTIYYDRPNPLGFSNPQVLLGSAAVGLTGFGVWLLRGRRCILFGLTWFLLALGPTSQIMPHHIARADRFLYLPLVGLAIAVAMAHRSPGIRAKRPGAVTAACLAAVALPALGALSARQVRSWRNSLTLWTHCITVEPNNPLGHSALADNLAAQGRFDHAVWHYETALRLAPTHAETLGDYAWALAARENSTEGDFELALRLVERACRLTGWREPRILRKYAVVHTNLGNALAGGGRFDEAIHHYRKAISADPSFETPCFGLALLLTTCPEEQLRQPQEAVRHAERGCRLIEAPDAHRLTILAAVYAGAGRFDDASRTIDRAIARAGMEGWSPEMTAELRRQKGLYHEGIQFDPLEP